MVKADLYAPGRIPSFRFSAFRSDGRAAGELVVFGGRALRLFSLSLNPASLLPTTNATRLEDWICDAVFLDDGIGILTAHNAIHLLSSALEVTRTVRGEPCLLFSGHLFGSAFDNLRAAAGTAINGILLWSPSQAAPVKLSGHEGPVHSVAFSASGTALASCGEDRTVRCYDIPVQVDDIGEEIQPKATMYGHPSRAWRVTFLGPNLVASAGEDATCRIWNPSLSGGRCLAVLPGHAKPDVWALAVDVSGRTLATGGSDSGICVWDVKRVLDVRSREPDPFVLPPWESYAVAGHEHKRPDAVRSFALLGGGKVVAATDAGYVFFRQTANSHWAMVCHDALFGGNARLAACGSGVLAASHSGQLVLLLPSESDTAWYSAARASCDLDAPVAGLHVRDVDGQLTAFFLNNFLPPSTHSFPMCFLPYGDLVLVGNAAGDLLMYAPGHSGPRLVVRGLHGGQAVSWLDQDIGVVCSGGGDGWVRAWAVGDGKANDAADGDKESGDEDGERPRVLHAEKIGNDDPDEHMDLTFACVGGKKLDGRVDRFVSLRSDLSEPLGRVVAAVFPASGFQIQDTFTGSTIFEERAGGLSRHRQCALAAVGTELNVGYLKTGTLFTYIQKLDADGGAVKLVVRSGLHSMKANAALFLPPDLLATGADDGDIRLSCVTPGRLLPLSSHRALGPVRGLSLAGGIAFAAGERGSLSAWDLRAGVCLATAPREGDPVRVTCVSAREVAPGCAAVFVGRSDGIVALWRFRDGAFDQVCWTDLHERCVLSCQLAKVGEPGAETLVAFSGATDGRILCLDLGPCAALAGEIGPVKLLPEEPLLDWILHRNGVNAMALSVRADELTLATGGDDGQITLSLFRLDDMELEREWTVVRGTGESSVRGVALVGERSVAALTADRRVGFWELDEFLATLEPIASRATVVADGGALLAAESSGDQLLVAVGQGIEVFDLHNE
ncbi:WD40-repeat-containing domain protein [Hyaloraphidium curvatum]|nr:WD40-repeat-containing domain protein [Hyaloraphidium curvatum]